MPPSLPIDPHLERIVAAAREHGAVVVVAAPGAGKTTRVPPALLVLGSVALLQPRRVAARALARRIAQEQGWTLGGEVGWQVRFERNFSERTRLLVMTEGVLTARLQSDPLLTDFGVAVLDEFHERSLHADLALALSRQAARARGDLRIVVMSATLDAAPVAAFLGGCPIVEVPGRLHDVAIEHAEQAPAASIRDALRRDGGHVLCFLPGAPEIRRLAQEIAPTVPATAVVLPLHGSLDADEQDRALAPSARRKVILATNLAETSLTVEGVTDVIDTGLQKVLRLDAGTGIDRLETERIAQDSADQRAGRAGRTGPGRAVRLWSASDRLRPHREPEVRRVDLAGALLDVLAWGGDPLAFEWFEAPPAQRVEAALDLLARLGAVRDGRITPLGETLRRFPLHPRLARVLVEAGGSEDAAAACALLSERGAPRGEAVTTDSDILGRLDRRHEIASVRDAGRELHALARRVLGAAPARGGEEALRRALLAGYPDRVARRREPGSPRLLLASGHGAVLGRESGVRQAEWLVALDVVAGPRGPASEAIVRSASAIDREWLEPTARDVVHRFDEASGSVRATARERYHALDLSEVAVSPDPETAAALLVGALESRGLGAENEAYLRRVAFAGLSLDLEALLRAACAGRTTLPRIALEQLVPSDVRRAVTRSAPEALEVPSGRQHRLDYRDDGSIVLAVKLQEMFGLAETPRLGPKRVAVTLSLLSPAGRPVQTTQDLRSFWERGYPEVRKELRGRYPRHPWPEDPWTAPPSARAKRR